LRISHKYKFVFLANRRCASHSIRALLDSFSDVKGLYPPVTKEQFDVHPFWDHMTATSLRKQFEIHGWDWGAYTKFAMIRNPWDRVVSHYLRALEKKESHLHLHAARAINFTTFLADQEVQAILAKQRLIPFSPEGEVLVNRLFRVEDMDVELPKFFVEIGVPIDATIPQLSSTQHGHYSAYYNDDARGIVAEIYRDDIRVGQYTFEAA
jgi:hypothetical protein